VQSPEHIAQFEGRKSAEKVDFIGYPVCQVRKLRLDGGKRDGFALLLLFQ